MMRAMTSMAEVGEVLFQTSGVYRPPPVGLGIGVGRNERHSFKVPCEVGCR